MEDTIYRQAAIDATWEEPTYTDPINVLTEVRDRIKALPSAQPNLQLTCNQLATDCISRQAAIDAVRHSPIIEVQPAYMLIDKADVLKNIVMLPSAQPEITAEQVNEYCKENGYVVLLSDEYNWLKSLKSKAEEYRWNGGGNY